MDWKYIGGLLSRNILSDEPPINYKKLSQTSFNFDYSWLIREQFTQIAHRGGNYSITGANTKKTILNSISNGRRFIEIDFIIDQNGNYICLNNNANLKDICDLNWVINKLNKSDFYLVVDLKFNVHEKEQYLNFYKRLTNYENFENWHSRIIPQAYNFEHLYMLNNFNAFSGPIFTTYKTNIPPELILEYLSGKMINAIALPFVLKDTIQREKYKSKSIFIFPVKTKNEYMISRKRGFNGIYSSTVF
ncbi:hypothetical protein N9364_00285 [Alphaproteobacteria bacterium]|nr:hypothetical protein [Alphaproteobacteria bacterium]